MPRGKYVNHKGRSRHFTSPEELQQETEKTSSEEEESGSEDDDTAGASTSKPKQKKEIKSKAEDSDDDDDSDEEDEDSDDDDRGARKGVAGLIEIENPNRAMKKTAQKVAKLSLEDKEETKPELSRREREQIEKQKARMRYEKLHAAGKTSEAKSDLARLAIIRQQRAEAAAKREAEKKAQETKKPGTASGGKA